MATAVELVGAEDDEGAVRTRSPRIMTSGWMTVLPPSMMFCVPTRMALRATLLPVSCAEEGELVGDRGRERGEGEVRFRCSRLLLGGATWWAVAGRDGVDDGDRVRLGVEGDGDSRVGRECEVNIAYCATRLFLYGTDLESCVQLGYLHAAQNEQKKATSWPTQWYPRLTDAHIPCPWSTDTPSAKRGSSGT